MADLQTARRQARARRRAQRGRWARQTGNDGRTRVRVPEDVVLERRRNVTPDVAPNAAPDITSNVAPDVAPNAATIKALEDHVATLKGEVERLKAQASEESAKTAQAIAAFESLPQRLEEMAAARRPWWRRLVG